MYVELQSQTAFTLGHELSYELNDNNIANKSTGCPKKKVSFRIFDYYEFSCLLEISKVSK